ncbi:hypothetical protein O1611_g7799 [Lasiodiplodia mahajangana]|uniref:Uncharacterized protein n=1 Tax=Lasiodiplodia mahajangana TaxID=1108764 RepID=A0ACC2JE79_9PEZI|nr:hypothetical protein O1611_g7799 [Lasiodiplodia mahajangana]
MQALISVIFLTRHGPKEDRITQRSRNESGHGFRAEVVVGRVTHNGTWNFPAVAMNLTRHHPAKITPRMSPSNRCVTRPDSKSAGALAMAQSTYGPNAKGLWVKLGLVPAPYPVYIR